MGAVRSDGVKQTQRDGEQVRLAWISSKAASGQDEPGMVRETPVIPTQIGILQRYPNSE